MTAFTFVAPGDSIQDAIDLGAQAIELGAGEYHLTAPLVPVSDLTIRGVGSQTRLIADNAMSAMIALGNGGPICNVMLTGFTVDCDNLADVGIDINIVGTTGFYQGEPDAICTLSDLRVYDPTLDGVVLRGTDTQACRLSNIRVRRADRYGFRVEAPDNWFTACEATTTTATGSSAGFFIGVLAGSNGIGASNNQFTACKAWYCRDYGWHVKGTRNRFTSCESQDTRLHGWYIEWDKNVYDGCTADTAGSYDVGGVSGNADGFYVSAGSYTSMVGCQAFDRKPGGHVAQQRYGLNVPTSMVTGGRLVAYSGYDNVSALLNQR